LKNLSVVLIALLMITGSIKAQEPEVEDNVLVLTDDNFDATLEKYEHILVEFYAPWCGHCKKLAPEYSAAAWELKAENLPLAKVDATVHKKVADRFKIQGFPTLKFFIKGNDMEYNGGRSKNDIVAWMRKKTWPASKEFTTVDQVENFTKSSDAVVVHFGSSGFDQYVNLAKTVEDASFGHCLSSECLSHYNVQNGTLVVFKNFDDKRNDLAAGYSAD